MYEAFLKWVVPFFCGGVLSLCGTAFAMWKNNRKKEKAIANGLQCLLRAEIIRSYEKYDDKGYCPLYAKEAIKRAYDSYHDLGGNDVATDLYRKMMVLPPDPKGDKDEKV